MTNKPSTSIVLACVSSCSQDPCILRMAQRHARARASAWYVAYLELWDDRKESRLYARNRALEQVALAERMGAVTFVVKAPDYVRGLQEMMAECARRQIDPALVVAGGVNAASPQAARRCVTAIEALSDTCELILVPPSDNKRRLNWLERLHMRRVTLASVLWTIIAVLVAFAIDRLLVSGITTNFVPSYAPSFMVYLIACAVVAGRFGLLPGMMATVASFVVLDVMTLLPQGGHGNSSGDGLSLALFVVTASLISLINSQVHAEAEASEINEWRMQALLQVYKIALHARSRGEALAELHANLKQFLHAEIAVYMPSLVAAGVLQPVWPESPNLDGLDTEIMSRTWEELLAGHDCNSMNPKSGWRFEPLSSANGEIGMLALRVPNSEATDTHFEQYLRMVAELVASILEKMESTDMKEESRVRDEREKLRTTLLSSVSHDLKTPLAAILGSLSVYRSMYGKLSEEQRRELTDAALIEAQRLDSFITNIIDLAKVESGAVKFKREWQSPEDLVNRVKKRMRMRFENHVMHVHPIGSEIEIEIDPVISEQALMNVLDNAIKYTPSGSTIDLRMQTEDGTFKIHVHDHGRGIAVEDRERIFDKYTRLQRQDHQVAGTGLGLALARAAMRGQGGDITVNNHEDGGAIFTLSWPQWRVAQ